MKVTVLGAGTWGFSLAALLAEKGIEVALWHRNPEEAARLAHQRQHPKLVGHSLPSSVLVTFVIEEALKGAKLVVESVTAAGFRSVVGQLSGRGLPLVITSKGIEQDTGLLLCEVADDLLGKEAVSSIACLSGPSHAEEVIAGLPVSVVAASREMAFAQEVADLFLTPTFRVYPNTDIKGVSFGGAMKNIIAIACGISDGLGLGDSAKAALMTRGLHEIKKLSAVKGCRSDTLYGLAGMGDLCVTCMSAFSRNYRFGRLLTEGNGVEQARVKVGMVVEGAYTCRSARRLGLDQGIPLPITEAVFKILYEGLTCEDAVKALMGRPIKEEYL